MKWTFSRPVVCRHSSKINKAVRCAATRQFVSRSLVCMATLIVLLSWHATRSVNADGPGFRAAPGAAEPVPGPVETTARLEIATATGVHSFTVEVADTPEKRAKGLMFRQEMAADMGMLFDYWQEQQAYFWMKNTPLSLDIIFIRADGSVARIAERTTPFSEKLIPSRVPIRYVLEVLAGTAAEIGLVAGDGIALIDRPHR